VEEGAAQREALLVAAGERPREAPGFAGEKHRFHGPAGPRPPVPIDPVQPAVEAEIFLHREVAVEAERLRHVPDPRLHEIGILDDVDARHDGRGNPYYWIAYARGGRPTGRNGTDLYVLAENRIAVTPLRLDMTDEPFMTQLAGLFSGNE
jgi:hypothetical protein